ncbi:glycoside hydrolase family 2 protein [Flavobacterium sp. FlaQc-48]|uniref:glycoside hydrolase family 2 protein n=1 Tax=Flavobacterium sp. FlaQc-48 TaxID=3374181 RepID=UPI003757FA02
MLLNRFLLVILLTVCGLGITYAGDFTDGEQRITLDGIWKFKTDQLDQGLDQKWYQSSYNDAYWEDIKVPGSWELLNQYAEYFGKAWYRTSFESPEIQKGKHVFLEFGAVSMSYRVFLNGQEIASVEAGNYVERFEVSSLLKKGKKNKLAVLIDNTIVFGAYTNWGGIRRPVVLSIVDPVFVQRQEIISTPDLAKGTALVNVKVFLQNVSDSVQSVSIMSAINFKGTIVKTTAPSVVKLPPGTVVESLISYKLNRSQTKLWDFDHPNLYQSTLTVIKKDGFKNGYSDRFGIRKIELVGYQFKLNGKSVRLAGYNWVADDRTSGNMLPEWRYKQDIDLMKMAGANMARLSHRPLPEDVMDYLDEKGILSISEFNNWSPYLTAEAEQPKIFAKKLIEQQFNHPSVIGWSVGNEMGNLVTHPKVNEYVSGIIKYIKTSLDPSRFVLYVSNTADYQNNDAAQYCDFIMINKYTEGEGFEKAVDKLKKRYPDKPVFMSEYGAYKTNLLYGTPNNTSWNSMLVDKVTAKENLFGYSVWTFNDYRSLYKAPNLETATPMHQNRQWGVIDVYRNKKRAYHQVRRFYAPVKNLKAELSFKDNKATASVSILPRAKADIPSFELKDYSLLWELRSKDEKTAGGGIISLPEILPGSGELNKTFEWEKNSNAAFLKIALLSPTGYNVLDTVIHLVPPPAPVIKEILKAPGEIRVVFDKNDFTDEYFLRYKQGGQQKESYSTIDHYIDIEGVRPGVPLELTLVARNTAGKSNSKVVSVSTENGYQKLPPVIWQVQPDDGKVHIGLGYTYSDFYYTVRYGTDLNDKSSWKSISCRVFGMFHLEGLKNGTKYYIQVAVAPQGLGQKELSVWSEVITTTPSLNASTGTPELKGVITEGESAVFVCKPATNGSFYKIRYLLNGQQKELEVNRSDFDYVTIAIPKNAKISDARLELVR